MNNYYFIYSNRNFYPYSSGYTVIKAKNFHDASSLFRIVHPDVQKDRLNCELALTEDEFEKFNSKGYIKEREQIEIIIQETNIYGK